LSSNLRFSGEKTKTNPVCRAKPFSAKLYACISDTYKFNIPSCAAFRVYPPFSQHSGFAAHFRQFLRGIPGLPAVFPPSFAATPGLPPISANFCAAFRVYPPFSPPLSQHSGFAAHLPPLAFP